MEDIFFPLFCDLCALTQEARVSADQSYRSIIEGGPCTGDQGSVQREDGTRMRRTTYHDNLIIISL